MDFQPFVARRGQTLESAAGIINPLYRSMVATEGGVRLTGHELEKRSFNELAVDGATFVVRERSFREFLQTFPTFRRFRRGVARTGKDKRRRFVIRARHRGCSRSALVRHDTTVQGTSKRRPNLSDVSRIRLSDTSRFFRLFDYRRAVARGLTEIFATSPRYLSCFTILFPDVTTNHFSTYSSSVA